MTSLSHDPFRFPFLPNGKFMRNIEPIRGRKSVSFSRANLQTYSLKGECPRLAGFYKLNSTNNKFLYRITYLSTSKILFKETIDKVEI